LPLDIGHLRRLRLNGISLFAQALGHKPRDARIVFDKQKPHVSIIRQVSGKVRKSRVASGVNAERWLVGGIPEISWLLDWV
jgi:hypothetical protein